MLSPPPPNPILDPPADPVAPLATADIRTTHRRDVSQRKRLLRDQRRLDTAREAVAEWTPDIELHGLTKGQFSIIDILTAVLDQIGPSTLDISTWTAANTDITRVLEFCESGALTASRWLVDLTFQRRSPQLAARIRQVFGRDAIRVAQNHAKFLLLTSQDYRVVITTSMNLNFNPRFENYTLAHDPALHAFYRDVFDTVWTRQPRSLAHARPKAILTHLSANM